MPRPVCKPPINPEWCGSRFMCTDWDCPYFVCVPGMQESLCLYTASSLPPPHMAVECHGYEAAEDAATNAVTREAFADAVVSVLRRMRFLEE